MFFRPETGLLFHQLATSKSLFGTRYRIVGLFLFSVSYFLLKLIYCNSVSGGGALEIGCTVLVYKPSTWYVSIYLYLFSENFDDYEFLHHARAALHHNKQRYGTKYPVVLVGADSYCGIVRDPHLLTQYLQQQQPQHQHPNDHQTLDHPSLKLL
jgi:hypothetical protein